MTPDNDPDGEPKIAPDEQQAEEEVEQQSEQPEQPEQPEDKAAMRKRESQAVAEAIITAAKERPYEISINSLATEHQVSRDYVRRILKSHNLILPSQEQSMEMGGGDVDQKIIHGTVQTVATNLTRSWSERTARDLLSDISLTGTVVVQEWRPLCLSRGQLVHTFLQEAVNDQKVLTDLKQRYSEQAESFGFHDDFLKYLSTVMTFHRTYHDIPIQLEQVEVVLENMLTKEAHEARTHELTALLLSGRKEDKAKFLLLTQGGQS